MTYKYVQMIYKMHRKYKVNKLNDELRVEELSQL